MSGAVLAKTTCKVDKAERRQTLAKCLRDYFRLLHSAKYDVFYTVQHALPVKEPINPDIAQMFPNAITVVDPVTIKEVNRYISTVWLRVVMLARAQQSGKRDLIVLSLAEYQTTWGRSPTEALYVSLKFTAP